jgi:hypothetical protein
MDAVLPFEKHLLSLKSFNKPMIPHFNFFPVLNWKVFRVELLLSFQVLKRQN